MFVTIYAKHNVHITVNTINSPDDTVLKQFDRIVKTNGWHMYIPYDIPPPICVIRLSNFSICITETISIKKDSSKNPLSKYSPTNP